VWDFTAIPLYGRKYARVSIPQLTTEKVETIVTEQEECGVNETSRTSRRI
jgi:hypothetical protein